MRKLLDLLQTKKEISLFKLFLGLFVIVAIIGGIYFFQKQNNPVNKQTTEVSDLLSKVGLLIDLPQNETPVIARITDAEKLKGESIFEKAVTGDYALIYNKAGKIIIYRPYANKIIETAPLSSIKTLSNSASQTQVEPKAVSLDNLTVSLYNAGATGSAILEVAENKLKEAYPKLKIVGKEESSKKTYTKNLIVDVKGSKTSEIKLLQDLFGADLSSLPEGESIPASDFLIIVVK